MIGSYWTSETAVSLDPGDLSLKSFFVFQGDVFVTTKGALDGRNVADHDEALGKPFEVIYRRFNRNRAFATKRTSMRCGRNHATTF